MPLPRSSSAGREPEAISSLLVLEDLGRLPSEEARREPFVHLSHAWCPLTNERGQLHPRTKQCALERQRGLNKQGGCKFKSPSAQPLHFPSLFPSLSMGGPNRLFVHADQFSLGSPCRSVPHIAHMPSNIGRSPTAWPLMNHLPNSGAWSCGKFATFCSLHPTH